jgi:hypothetical protein
MRFRGGCPPIGRIKWIASLAAGDVNHAVCVNGEGLVWHDPDAHRLNGLSVPRDRLLFGLRIVPAGQRPRGRLGRTAPVMRSRAGWRQRRAFLERWIAANGYVCPGLDGIPHEAVSLEVDHVVPVALDYTYYSDGLHAAVSGSNPYSLDIDDSLVCSSPPTDPRTGNNNFTATITIS